MPTFSELLLDSILCPHYKQHSDIPGGVVKFQWGKIPYQYRLGERIVWLRDRAGDGIRGFVSGLQFLPEVVIQRFPPG